MLWHSLVTNALRRLFWGCYGYIAFNDAKPDDITVGYGIVAWWLHRSIEYPLAYSLTNCPESPVTNVAYTVTPQPVDNFVDNSRACG